MKSKQNKTTKEKGKKKSVFKLKSTSTENKGISTHASRSKSPLNTFQLLIPLLSKRHHASLSTKN